MAQVYARLILAGMRTFESVPDNQKAKVRQLLKAAGAEMMAV